MPCQIVLLPGLDGTGEQFAPLVAALSPDVPSVVVRYPDAPLDYDALRQIAASSLPRGGTYIVLGESFSGPVAISLAALSPPGLLGCILCASFVRSPRRILKLALPFIGLMPPRQVPSVFADFLVIGRFNTPALSQMQVEARNSLSPATLVARFRAIAREDVSDKLRALSLPTLYMRATEDRLVPRSAGDYFAQLAQAGRVVDLEGPHFLLQARPALAAAEIRKFIGELK